MCTKRECLMRIRAEIQAMLLEAKECQMATSHRKLGERAGTVSLLPSAGPSPAHTFILGFEPPDLGDSAFLLLMPLCV